LRAAVGIFLRIAFRFYYRRVYVRDEALVPAEGPLLLVANHPNSLVDPALLIHILRRPVHFGARHRLFETPLGPILTALGVIPIVRLQDDPRSMRRNLDSIEVYANFLEQGRATAIFPEGLSQDSLQLAPVKNGAARIALRAEAGRDFRLGLHVVPVGLQFEPRRRFRGEAFVRFGQPLSVTDLATLHRERPRDALRELSGRIGKALTGLTVHVESIDRAWLVDRLSEVYFRRALGTGLLGTGRSGLHGELRYRMAVCLNYFSGTDSEVVDQVERSLRRYDRLLKAAGVGSRLVEEPAYLLPGILAPVQAVIEIVVGFLPAVAGLVTGGVPYLLTRHMARYLASRNRHMPSLSIIHILIGALAFPLAYVAEILLVWRLLGTRAAGVFAILLVPAGLFALWFVRRVRKLAVHVSGRLASWLRLDEVARVRQAQRELLVLMDRVRARYLGEVFGIRPVG
jgi:1-acyl-sn-glycerol-3-phosphate acyltransferase